MSSDPRASPAAEATPTHRTKMLPLALGALGIVFGDIGTSPLYAMQECFVKKLEHGVLQTPGHALVVSSDNVMGILSLFFWSLTMVVSVKYLGFIMKADNKGEGGIFALLALLPGKDKPSRGRAVVVLVALFGAALLYGDGIITPAVSVLSAVEGLQVATHEADRLVVPITVAILFGLFTPPNSVQMPGTLVHAHAVAQRIDGNRDIVAMDILPAVLLAALAALGCYLLAWSRRVSPQGIAYNVIGLLVVGLLCLLAYKFLLLELPQIALATAWTFGGVAGSVAHVIHRRLGVHD